MSRRALVTYVAAAKDGVSQIVLNRPEAHNALNQAVMDDLGEAFEALDQDPRARAMVLRGEGPSFCSGADTKTIDLTADGVTLSPVQALPDMFLAPVNRVPVVGAVHGFVIGAGVRIAMYCDMLLAANTTQFRLPEVTLDLDPRIYWRMLTMTAGSQFATDVCLTGRAWSAAEALAHGVVTRTTQATVELLPMALALARDLASLPETSVNLVLGSRREAIRDAHGHVSG